MRYGMLQKKFPAIEEMQERLFHDLVHHLGVTQDILR